MFETLFRKAAHKKISNDSTVSSHFRLSDVLSVSVISIVGDGIQRNQTFLCTIALFLGDVGEKKVVPVLRFGHSNTIFCYPKVGKSVRSQVANLFGAFWEIQMTIMSLHVRDVVWEEKWLSR